MSNFSAADVKPSIRSRTLLAVGVLIDEFDLQNLGSGPSAPFEMSLFCVAPGSESIAESHDDAELWLVVAGTGRMLLGDRVLCLYPGRVIAIGPGVVHQVTNTGLVGMRIFSIWWGCPEKTERDA